MTEIQRLQNVLGEWSDKTFGNIDNPTGCLNHLKKEVDELIDSPRDEMEYADCMMLIIDAYRKIGGTADELVQACFEKYDICLTRTWGPPDENGVSQHIRENDK